MHPVFSPTSRPGDKQWHDTLDAMRECVADHVRVATTDALIAVEHDWMVNSFISKSEFTAQALSTLSHARGDVVDEIEARVRARFDPVSHNQIPSLQSEMDRARSAKAAKAGEEAIEAAYGAAIQSFGRRFETAAENYWQSEIRNPLDGKFIIEQMLETLAGMQLPHSMRQAVLEVFTRKWINELRAVLGDVNGHLARYEIRDQAAPTAPVHTARAAADKVQFTRVEQAYDTFEWSTTLGAGDVLDSGPHLKPTPLQPQPEPAAVKRLPGASILPFRRPVSKSEALQALGSMQRQPPLAIRAAFEGQPGKLGERLREELVGELRAIQPHNMAPLSPRDEHAAGTVGDMFQEAVGDEELQDRGKGALSRMVVPVLKAAVIDRAPFDQQDHPARKLLSSLAEAIKDSKGPKDREDLISRAEDAVDRVVAEFNEDMAILTVIEQELRGFMQQWEMVTSGGKADVAEVKRVSEINATHALLERTAGVSLPYAVAEFMTGPWHRRLVRFGMMNLAGGPEWVGTLDVADRLLALWSVHPPTRRDAAHTINQLAPQIDAIWLDDGAPLERAQQHRAQMLTALDDVLRPEDIDQHERQVARMEAEMAEKPATEEDREFIQSLRVGDWMMLTGPDGATRQVKLSWISPLSDRRLFVSRQGVRVMVGTLDELAALKRIGRLRTE